MPWILGVLLVIFVPLGAIYVYVGRKIHQALITILRVDRRRSKFILWVAAVFFNLLPIAFAASFLIAGPDVFEAFNGESFLIDVSIVYPFWFALVITVQLFFLFAVADLTSLILYPLFRRMKDSWIRNQSRYNLMMVALIVPYSVATIVSDTWTVRVREKEVKVPDSYAALSGLKIAQISDVQGDGRTTGAVLREYVQRVNDLQPDLIIFAGDLVTSGRSHIESTADVMGGLDATYGVFAIVGDHDIFSNREQVVNSLQRNGISVIEDSTAELMIDSIRVALTGVTYTYRTRPPAELLQSVTNNHDGRYKIFLVHQPRESLVRLAASKGYDLFLAGHTHGGGIAFGIPGLFLVAPASFETSFVSGFYDVGNMLVSVTNGLGFTVAPIRFHAPAEITLLRLTK